MAVPQLNVDPGTGLVGRVQQRVARLWHASQVELTGQYSVERMLAFELYSYESASWFRVFAVYFGTIAPSLLAVLVLESLPLAPIEGGFEHSRNFWIRTLLGSYMVTHAIIVQYQTSITRLSLSTTSVVVMSAMTSVVAVPLQMALAYYIGFPLPFFVIVGMAPWLVVLSIILGVKLRSQLLRDPQLLVELREFSPIVTLQVMMTLTYPAYTYAFNQLGPTAQTALALLLPVIKFGFKNLFARVSRRVHDLRPELVVFNVEIFSALYVSSCMQSASSTLTTVAIMVVDFVHAWLSIKDLNDVFNDANLRQALSRVAGHSSTTVIGTRSLLPLTMVILKANEYVRMHPSVQIRSCAPVVNTNKSMKMLVKTHSAHSQSPTHLPKNVVVPEPTLGGGNPQIIRRPTLVESFYLRLAERDVDSDDAVLQAMVSRLDNADQLLIVQGTLRILHICEFIALIEYAEVFVPIMYSLFCTIAYSFPNGKYYTTFGSLSPSAFAHTLVNVLVYGVLELVSFVGFALIVRRKFKVSVVAQTAFVLESQCAMVQSKLMLWMIIVLQFALRHYGNDFSFHFAWLKSQPM